MAYNYGEPLEDLTGLTEFAGRDSVDLLARMVYSESGNQTEKGKRGCAHVAKNRKAKNQTQFGGATYEGVILKQYQFAGMTTEHARKPDLTSDAWKDSLAVASTMSTNVNPIGGCLWFNTNTLYKNRIKTENSKEYYTFNGGTTYTEVTEKVVIGDHTFFNLSGY